MNGWAARIAACGILTLLFALVGGPSPGTTSASAAAFTYDGPAIARVAAHAIHGAEASPAQLCVSRDESASPSVEAQGTCTTLVSRSVATNTADDLLGAACRSNSFDGTTRVLMADGSTKPIEDIVVGDWVRALDPEAGESGSRVVTDVIVGDGRKELVEVTVRTDDGDTAIVSTAKHPFWVDDDGRWTDAADLEIGDQLLAADGSRSEVVETRRFDAVQRVHNLTVDGIHTYFVVAGHEPVLVHNCGNLDALSAAGRAADRNGLTAAGRAAQKHGAGTGARAGNGFPTPPTGAANLNEFGQNLLDDLLTAPNTATRTFTQPGYGQVTEFWGPNYGARFGPNGEFIGFL